MKKTFDELYKEFFNKKQVAKKRKVKPKPIEDEKDMYIDMLSDSEYISKYINSLGDPNKVEFYNEGDVFYEKRIWHTELGDVVKIIISDEPFFQVSPIPEKTLEENLAIAVENEDYEKAAVLRDLIKKDKKNKK